MDLKDVRFGIGHTYQLNEPELYRKCHILASHPDDGACLIVQLWNEEGDDLDHPDNYVPTEACYLELVESIRTVDIEESFWEQIKTAAEESNWIPKEHYFMNDWVADVCRFLREGLLK